MLDFDAVFLSRNELEILRSADSGKVVDTTHVPVPALLSYGFLSQYPLNENQYVITPLGCDYCEFLDRKSLEKKRRERKESFRYWVTTILAVLAFILSVISVSWQVYKDLRPNVCTTCAAAQSPQP